MKKLIGTRSFYSMVLALALPILLQNALSTFVNLLDNLMVGQVGTEQMSGVSIVNQLLFVFNLCIFGGTGGAGIFGAQYFGRGDQDGVRHTLRFNMYLCVGFSLLAVGLLYLWQTPLIRLFLHDAGGGGDLEATLAYGRDYLGVMLWGLLPFGVTWAYAGILRVAGDTKLPMVASMTAVLLNLFFNWLLIFGNWGFPVLGVRGAAIATVISRYVEAALVVLFTHRQKKSHPYAVGLYRSGRIPGTLVRGIFLRGLPLMVNELFWSLGMTAQLQCYSQRGLEAVAAMNIANVVVNLFNIVMFTMGNTVGIILGNELGAEEYDRAKADCPRLMAMSSALCALMGLALFFVAPWAPRLYKTTPAVMALATGLMRVTSCMLPIHALTNASYFALRAGGRTLLTILFDSVFSWLVYVPVAFVLVRYTALELVMVYALVNCMEFFKVTLGVILVRRGVWLRNIVTA